MGRAVGYRDHGIPYQKANLQDTIRSIENNEQALADERERRAERPAKPVARYKSRTGETSSEPPEPPPPPVNERFQNRNYHIYVPLKHTERQRITQQTQKT